MAFRNTSFACPSCHEALAADAAIAWCKGCQGAWVSEAELEERVRVVRGKNEPHLELLFGRLDAAHRSQTRRACPVCRDPLGHTRLGTAEVDRCDQKHGIWFDAGELEVVLTAATEGVAVKARKVKLTWRERLAWHTQSSPRDPNEPVDYQGIDEEDVDLITSIVRFVVGLIIPG